MAFDALFQPIEIGKLTIRNRVVSTAHAEVYATDGGMTTDRYVRYYEEKAKGGCGLCICGGSSVVSIDSPQAGGAPSICRPTASSRISRIWPMPCTSMAARS